VSLLGGTKELRHFRNWCIASAMVAVVIGCGGGSGAGGGGNGGGSGGGGQLVPTVLLGDVAQVQMLFASGQGRRAPGSTYATLQNFQIQNGPVDFVPSTFQGSSGPIRSQLDGYSLNSVVFSERIIDPEKTFVQLPIEILRVEQEDSGGVLQTIFTGPFRTNPPFKLRATLMPGRQTSIQLNLNDSIVTVANNVLNFDRGQFERENYDPADRRVNGFLSDMVSFDLSSVPAVERPEMLNGSGACDRVFFSGDAIGIGRGFNTQGSFELLNPLVVDEGVLKAPATVGGRPIPGTYSVLEPDPRDPFNDAATIAALQGIYREHTEVLTDIPAFTVLVLPNTRGDINNQVVAFLSSGNTITKCWQGVARFNKATSGIIEIWSLDQLDEGTAFNKAQGTLTFTKEGGVVKKGVVSFSTTPSGFPFPLTGGFAVFRR
jgi:hypothetical protein